MRPQGPTHRPIPRPRRAHICFGLVVALAAALAWAPAWAWSLKVTGAVCSPRVLNEATLRSFAPAALKLNDLTSGDEFRGCFWCWGPSLRGVLELAGVCPGRTKPVALGVIVRGGQGRAVALSWGEIFYHQPGQAILATSYSPVMPHHSCSRCHDPGTYQQWLSQLKRKVVLPRLVMGGDERSDRCVEGVREIELVDLGKPRRRLKRLYSPRIILRGHGKRLVLGHMPALKRISFTAGTFGEGRGFHGVQGFKGVSLKRLLKWAGMSPGIEELVVVSAPDGYVAVFSGGELALNPSGARVIIAEEVDGQPIGEGGRYWLIVPADLWADRWVKAVEEIRVVKLGRREEK